MGIKLQPNQTLLGPDILNMVWQKWYERAYDSDAYTTYRIHRHSPLAIAFESWLMESYGATVRQINKKRYLCFDDAAKAVIFAMKWS